MRLLRRHNEKLRQDILPRLGKESAQRPLSSVMNFSLIDALDDLNNAISECRYAIELCFHDEKPRRDS